MSSEKNTANEKSSYSNALILGAMIVGGATYYGLNHYLEQPDRLTQNLNTLQTIETVTPEAIGTYATFQQCERDTGLIEACETTNYAMQLLDIKKEHPFSYESAAQCVENHRYCFAGRGSADGYFPYLSAVQYQKADPAASPVPLFTTKVFGQAIRADGQIFDVRDEIEDAHKIHQAYFQDWAHKMNLDWIQNEENPDNLRIYATVEQCVKQGAFEEDCRTNIDESRRFVREEKSAVQYNTLQECKDIHGQCLKSPFNDKVVPVQVATQSLRSNVTPLYASVEDGMAFRKDGVLVDISRIGQDFEEVSPEQHIKTRYDSDLEIIGWNEDSVYADINVQIFSTAEQCAGPNMSIDHCTDMLEMASLYAQSETTAMSYDTMEACVEVHGECFAAQFNNQVVPKQVAMQEAYNAVTPLYASAQEGKLIRGDGKVIDIPSHLKL